MSTFAAGLIGILALILISYLAYTKFANPFASKFTIHALFSNANGVRPNSLVRIAGINVGKVTGVEAAAGCGTRTRPAGNGGSGGLAGGGEASCAASKLTMEIDDNGLPLHKDATFNIRPRIFLEGNFFIDVHPGTDSAGNAPDGYTFPISQGTEPVQIDQVLGALPSDTRRNLQILLKEYGTAVKVGGPSYNASIAYWLPAYKYSGIVAHDFLGKQPHDLSTWIDMMGRFAGALDSHPQQLKSFITDFNTTANAFARQSAALQAAVAELPRTLSVAIPTFNALNASFPPLENFARALLPGVITTGPAIDTNLPLITQLRLLMQPSELRGLAGDLSVTVPALARLTATSIPFMRNGVRPASSCVANDIIPWSHLTLNDPNFNASNGFPPHQVYVESVEFLPGLAGESRVFDANGPYIRILGTGGTFTYSLQPGLFGQALAPIAGVQPQLPAAHSSGDGSTVAVSRPPLKPKVPCETQPAVSDLSAPAGTGPTQITSTDKWSPTSSKQTRVAYARALLQLQALAKQQGFKIGIPRVPDSAQANGKPVRK